MTSNASLPSGDLAPSELVLLNGERFEGLSSKLKRLLGANVQLLHVERKVPAPDLGLAVLATVALANEQAGAVRVEVREKKELLGLRRVQTIYFEPTGAAAPAWPEGSLEAAFLPAIGRAKTREADAVFEQLLATTTTDAWQHAIQLAQEGLAKRNLLERQETRTLKVFKTHKWTLPDATLRRARAAPAEPALALVDDTRKSRPDLWEILEREIVQAINRRTERDDDMDWD